MRVFGVAVGVTFAIAAGGCGSTALTPSTSSLCSSSCATVTGVVERCGGPAPGACIREKVTSVSLLDAKGREAMTEFPAKGHTLSTFSLTAEVPGRYKLETTADQQRITRLVTLRAGHITRANLILEVK